MDASTLGSQAVKTFLSTGFTRKWTVSTTVAGGERVKVCSFPFVKAEAEPQRKGQLPSILLGAQRPHWGNLGQQLRTGVIGRGFSLQIGWLHCRDSKKLLVMCLVSSELQELAELMKEGAVAATQAHFSLHMRLQCSRPCLMQSRFQHRVTLTWPRLTPLHFVEPPYCCKLKTTLCLFHCKLRTLHLKTIFFLCTHSTKYVWMLTVSGKF